jgi:hypothetical protein
MSTFTDEFLEALGAWQNGWREIQPKRELLAENLCREANVLSDEFRKVNGICYRKRFIHNGELVDLFIRNHCDEGVASWTLDLRFAERLKGLTRQGAVSAAIFEYQPLSSEIIVSLPALWASKGFRASAESYLKRDGYFAAALMNFRDSQQEIILRVPLRGSEIIALTGASSPFDDLCDRTGIPENKRDSIFSKLIQSGEYPGDPQYIDRNAAQRAIARSVQRLYGIHDEHISKPGGNSAT